MRSFAVAMLFWLVGCSSPTVAGDGGLPDAALDAGVVDGALDLARPDRLRPDRAVLDRGLATPEVLGGLGAKCGRDGECQVGLFCDTALPGGSCTRACSGSGVGLCGGKAVCAYKRCWAGCNIYAMGNPCRSGYVCDFDGEFGRCVPHCSTAGCPGTRSCHASTGVCLELDAGGPGALCGRDAGSCAATPNGICIRLNTTSNSFCSIPCVPFTQPCPSSISGAACMPLTAAKAYCVYVCDPKKPVCPQKTMECKAMSSNTSLCFPK